MVARRGERYAPVVESLEGLEDERGRGQVLDQEEGLLFEPFDVQSILANGYREPVEPPEPHEPPTQDTPESPSSS